MKIGSPKNSDTTISRFNKQMSLNDSHDLPKITFTVPTYNASSDLKKCLEGIRKQDYPQEKIEIIIADGGSSDDTVEVARGFGAKVLDNPKKLSEFGVPIAIQKATGDLVVSLATDNELCSDIWIRKMIQPFVVDEKVCAVWGKLISSEEDARINKYYELIQSDPFTFFMNRNLDMYLRTAEQKEGDTCLYFSFYAKEDYPLPWGANGIAYRTDIIQDIWKIGEYLGDNDAFQCMIESGKNKVAYIPSLNVYHHTVRSLPHWISKWKRNYIKHFLTKRRTRNLNWAFTRDFQSKLLLWLIYSLAPIFSSVDTIYKIIKDRNFYWIYHPLVCFVQSITYGYLTLSTKSGRMMVHDLISGRLFSKSTEQARSLATENGNKPILITD